MRIKVIGSTKPGYYLPIDEALEYGGISAGICYMPESFETLASEDIQKTKRRVQRTLQSGHHSVYDHPTYNFLFEDIPKILAMVLNNEGFYTTSEKSARYTKMNPSEQERFLYYKWIDILRERIQKVSSKITKTHTEKLAQENARYMISVFTPTTMEYTVSLRQISGIISMMRKFIEASQDTLFNKKLKECMLIFIEQCKDFEVPHLNNDIKSKEICLFDTRKKRGTEFGENYSINYLGSFAQLAQAHRHRTLDYRIKIPDYDINNENQKFYIPPILRMENNDGSFCLEDEWVRDIKTVSHVFPQGMLIEINERGTYENFILKIKERLCGSAQLEISQQTEKILLDYLLNLSPQDIEIRECLEKYVIKQVGKHDVNSIDYVTLPRCRFPGWKCNDPCIWGAKSLERLV